MKMKLIQTVIALTILLDASFVLADTVVVVHPSNNATFDQDVIADLFLGKRKEFSDGARANPVTTEEESEAKQAFNNKVLNKSTSRLNSYWAKLIFTGKGRPPKMLANDEEVKQQIINNALTIGVIDANSVDTNVKVVYQF